MSIKLSIVCTNIVVVAAHSSVEAAFSSDIAVDIPTDKPVGFLAADFITHNDICQVFF